MKEQTFVKIRKTLAISLAVCFLILLTAAAASAAKIVVYQDINFGGEHFDSTTNTAYVGDHWNDRISSIKVKSGYWRFYQDINYGGNYWDLGPGDYPWVEDVGIPNDIISSYKKINKPKVILYEHINYGGGRLFVDSNQKYIGNQWNDKISSIQIKSGKWRFYEDANYGGRHWDLGPGNYPWVENAGIPNDIISSYKKI